jgi:hypothetical protein
LSSDFSNQDYTVWFNGTSAACPHVAGVAALILSLKPELTQKQVTFIIEQTANKVGSGYATTQDRPNGTWSNQTGYGLVNAYAALTRTIIFNTPLTGGSIYVMGGDGQTVNVERGATPPPFSSGGSPTGGSGAYTYTWEWSPDKINWTTIAGATTASYHYAQPLFETKYFRRAAHSMGKTAYSNILTLISLPASSGSLSVSDIYCSNIDPIPKNYPPNIGGGSPSGGYGSYEYQWEISDQPSYYPSAEWKVWRGWSQYRDYPGYGSLPQSSFVRLAVRSLHVMAYSNEIRIAVSNYSSYSDDYLVQGCDSLAQSY